jgi:hypothetical protein
MTDAPSYEIHALDAARLAAVRATLRDASGNPVERLLAEGGEPLRCCLRDARPGEALLLFGYEPPIGASPYREVGAVYACEAVCAGPAAPGYPAAWARRPQVLRGYDARGWIVDAIHHDGTAPEVAIARLLADPRIVQLHSRNVAYGCFMFRVVPRVVPAAGGEPQGRQGSGSPAWGPR